MKLVTAIIRPSRLDAAIDALSALGVDRLAVIDARGFGAHHAGPGASPAPEDKLEVAVPDAKLAPVVEALRAAALTGKAGDGIILVEELLQAVRIRNRERGEGAL